MSLPPLAAWEYMYDENTYPEGKHTLELLKKGVEWVN
jgi:coproporphyrinogen III oxidase